MNRNPQLIGVLLVLTLSSCPLFLRAQSADSIILNETTLGRPLTNHKNQFRVFTGYDLGFNLGKFDDGGSRINLLESGTSSFKHSLQTMVWYGLTDRLQAVASVNFESQTERSQTVYHLQNDYAVRLKENTTNEFKGASDPYVGLDYRIPFHHKKHDWVVSGGAFLPIAAYKPPRPEISLDNVPDNMDIFEDYEANYKYKHAYGRGVLQLKLNSQVKFRLNKTGITLAGGYQFAPTEGKSIQWLYQLDLDSSVQYKAEAIRYRLSGQANLNLIVERQIFQWFSLNAFYGGLFSDGGWTTGLDQKVTSPSRHLHTIGLGYELLVTHKLWLRQSLSTALSGRNSYSPISISITAVYNFWPN